MAIPILRGWNVLARRKQRIDSLPGSAKHSNNITVNRAMQYFILLEYKTANKLENRLVLSQKHMQVTIVNKTLIDNIIIIIIA